MLHLDVTYVVHVINAMSGSSVQKNGVLDMPILTVNVLIDAEINLGCIQSFRHIMLLNQLYEYFTAFGLLLLGTMLL